MYRYIVVFYRIKGLLNQPQIAATAIHETLILPNQPSKNVPITSTLPFNFITSNDQCEISERHHRTQPFKHVHSVETDGNRDCVTGNISKICCIFIQY